MAKLEDSVVYQIDLDMTFEQVMSNARWIARRAAVRESNPMLMDVLVFLDDAADVTAELSPAM